MTDSAAQLAAAGATAAMREAAEYLRACDVQTSQIDVDALRDAVVCEIKAALPAALNDAREAFGAGMGGFAVPTFLAAMRLAGIKAAADVSGAAPQRPVFVGTINPA